MEKKIKIYILAIFIVLALTGFIYIRSLPENRKTENYASLEKQEQNTDLFEQAEFSQEQKSADLENIIEEENLTETDEQIEETGKQVEEPNEVIEETDRQIEIKIGDFLSDKNIYGSREKIYFTLEIWSESNIEKALIKIKGIEPYNYAYINKSKEIILYPGKNTFVVEAEAPSCTSGCGGVSSGAYDIHSEIIINNQTIDRAEITINLTDNN